MRANVWQIDVKIREHLSFKEAVDIDYGFVNKLHIFAFPFNLFVITSFSQRGQLVFSFLSSFSCQKQWVIVLMIILARSNSFLLFWFNLRKKSSWGLFKVCISILDWILFDSWSRFATLRLAVSFLISKHSHIDKIIQLLYSRRSMWYLAYFIACLTT